MVLALTGIGAARVPDAVAPTQPTGLCVPLLTNCSAPTPSPTPTAPVLGGVVGGLLGGGSASTGSGGGANLPIAVRDPNAPVMTLPAAQLGGSSLSIQGLQSVGIVTVPLANGKRTRVIRLVADDVAIDAFVLDVRKATGPSAVTHADRMELRGHVVVYLNSLSATLVSGVGLTLGANTPIPGDELPGTLLRPTLGLVGVTAGSITFTNNDLFIS
jgi:hypothetical protein